MKKTSAPFSAGQSILVFSRLAAGSTANLQSGDSIVETDSPDTITVVVYVQHTFVAQLLITAFIPEGNASYCIRVERRAFRMRPAR
jgi:hypothetical protein